METVQGYVILKAATFETGHGFALGHNPGAPSPFVTWQFTEGENGHRDYYWGRYGTSQAWAQRDFDRRVDDYQQFYHAAVKHTELGPEGVYRYYSTQRPVDIGTYPKLPDNQPLFIVNYDDDRRRPVADGIIWAGGYFSGLYQIDKRTSKTTYFTPASYAHESIRPDKYIRDIRKDSRGYVWSGGYYNLKRINVQTKDIRLYHGLHSVTAIIEKDDKSMWIGTATGLFLLEIGRAHV